MDTQDTRDSPDNGDTVATSPAGTLLSAEAAGDALGVSARQVRRYGADGTLQAVREHGRIRYRADDIARLAAARGLAAPAISVPRRPAEPTTGAAVADSVDAPDTPPTATGDTAATGDKGPADSRVAQDTSPADTPESKAMPDTADSAEPDIAAIEDTLNLATKTEGLSHKGHTPARTNTGHWAPDTSLASVKVGSGPPRDTQGPEAHTPATADSGQRIAHSVDDSDHAALLSAVEGLRDELRAAREDSRKLTDDLGMARREAGLWEGRARTLDERLRQVEKLTLPTIQDTMKSEHSERETKVSGQQTAEHEVRQQSLLARLLARLQRK